MDVAWPWRHESLIEAAALLASEPPTLVGDDPDPSWPDLSWAVHEVVDDTSWDLYDPSGSIGTILRNDVEASAARELVHLLVQVSERQGADAPDSRWFSDPGWGAVRATAIVLLHALTAADATMRR